LASEEGTFVGGRRVDASELALGDTIRIGKPWMKLLRWNLRKPLDAEVVGDAAAVAAETMLLGADHAAPPVSETLSSAAVDCTSTAPPDASTQHADRAPDDPRVADEPAASRTISTQALCDTTDDIQSLRDTTPCSDEKSTLVGTAESPCADSPTVACDDVCSAEEPDTAIASSIADGGASAGKASDSMPPIDAAFENAPRPPLPMLPSPLERATVAEIVPPPVQSHVSQGGHGSHALPAEALAMFDDPLLNHLIDRHQQDRRRRSLRWALACAAFIAVMAGAAVVAFKIYALR
jgi:hypothetical protein